MNVLIIGGTGVISTAIVDRLNEFGHDTTVYNRGLRPIRYKQAVHEIKGDKKDEAAFIAEMKNRRFDAVIDMISFNPKDAAVTLGAFKDHDTHFVFTSTVAVHKRPFKNAERIQETYETWDTEEYYPYGFHKARMEDFLNGQMLSGRKITIIRPSLTYGLGSKNIGVLRQNYGIVKRIQQGKPLIMFGDGTTPWEFTFALDLAKAYTGVLRRDVCYGQTYHATSGDARIWDDLYLEFGKIIGCEPKILHMSTEMLMAAAPERISHIYQEKMWSGLYDNSKIKSHVPEFTCEYTLDKTLRAVYDWYMTDEQARIVDKELDLLEDNLVHKYHQCLKILAD